MILAGQRVYCRLGTEQRDKFHMSLAGVISIIVVRRGGGTLESYDDSISRWRDTAGRLLIVRLARYAAAHGFPQMLR